ncbi:acyl-CoA N-acyltransferase [Ilyonectria robusta]|uniref:acyl-CoA N-acyltransferase n=1 Tax=Ilyonectria robusta TaxID=1079257 RepID=UPI001E8D76C0|nr:acyl-CoA N-acyltransferase [Ilyonectria robusta]KAH8735771.1 acyl-CoA N-acyltransferase [Ilyonectria robusta]
MSDSGTVALFSPAQHGHLIPYLAAIHASCITHDRTIATFLPPLSHEKLLAWWKERIAEVNDGKRLIFILLNESEPGTRAKGGEVMGVVMLSMPYSETGPFRGFVEKLLVHKNFRGRGGARALLGSLEIEAVKRGRSMLLLDTESGSAAEEVFKKFGYVELGRIPNYGLSPARELKDGTFFYKQLQ